jgi:hypothetical protein
MSEYYTKEEAEKAIEALDVKMVDTNDHVSKSELREWCEHYISLCEEEGVVNPAPWQEILEKFCKGEK